VIKQQARVSKVYNDKVELECALNSSCSGCSNESNCGVGTVAKAFSGKTQLISVNTTLILSPGQWVTIGIAEDNLLLQAFVTYLFPLLGLLGMGMLGQWFFVDTLELPSLVGLLSGLCGGYLSFIGAKYTIKRLGDRSPEIKIIAVDY